MNNDISQILDMADEVTLSLQIFQYHCSFVHLHTVASTSAQPLGSDRELKITGDKVQDKSGGARVPAREKRSKRMAMRQMEDLMLWLGESFRIEKPGDMREREGGGFAVPGYCCTRRKMAARRVFWFGG